MIKTNETKIRLGLDIISKLLPDTDFYGAIYSDIANRKRFLYYYKNGLHINLSPNNPSIPKHATVVPLLRQYMINRNKNIELVDDYINILLKDCNPIEYSQSMINISDIQTIHEIGRICFTTINNYKSLSKLIPEFKEAVIRGTITVPIAVDLALLDSLSQLKVYKEFKEKGIDLNVHKVNYRLLQVAVNAKILKSALSVTINFNIE